MPKLLWIILIFIFIFRFSTTQKSFKDGQVLEINGSVYNSPTTSNNKTRFNLSGLKVTGESLNISYGDKVSLIGVWKKGEVEILKVERIKPSSNLLIIIRQRLINFYQNALPGNGGALLAGITIGAKENLTFSFKNKLIQTGTTHLVVASGTNITIAGSFVLAALLRFIKRRKALIMTSIFICLYIVITGFEAPILRAGLMAILAFTGQIFGRVVNTLKLTFLTGIILLILVPNWISDIGFLLSFATTLSLILFSKNLNNLLKFVPNFLREDLSTSLAAQIGSAPIIFFFFNQFNILSPLYNILVLWTIPPIMVFGILGGILSFISRELGNLLLLPIKPLLYYFISVVNL